MKTAPASVPAEVSMAAHASKQTVTGSKGPATFACDPILASKICFIRAGERMRRVANLTPRPSSSPRMAWVVTFWSMISIFGSDPETCFQWWLGP
jgi:hypothetical protein